MLQETVTFPLLQNLNLILNMLTLMGVGAMVSIVWGYKRRVKERYDDINKRLDHILLLSNELYQSDKDAKRDSLEDQKDLTNTGAPSSKVTRRSRL